MKKVAIYTTHSCPYCRMAKSLLKRRNIPFEEIDVSDDEQFETLVDRTGFKTVPQIFFDYELIGGYEELSKLDEAGKLKKKLGEV
ncbi:MAG: glutaredoxin domain-containing protein [Deltaproteobacteria bacterium]|nr:glutaredoxin domain-containing protein [Deltaproteobacteria bacterium]